MNTPITQSQAWHKLQKALGETSFFVQNKDFSYLAILKSTPVGSYLYLPYGPIYQEKANFQKALKSLETLAKEHQALFIRIEPQDPNFKDYSPKNAQKTTDLNPKETWVLDLTGNDDDLKAKLPSRLLRYHRTAPKKGLILETSHDPADIHYLLDLQTALASQKHINTFSEDYLKTELSQPFATLYLLKQVSTEDPDEKSHSLHRSLYSQQTVPSPKTSADQKFPKINSNNPNLAAGDNLDDPNVVSESAYSNRDVIAAGLVFDDGTTRYNLQGAQTEQGRKLHATGILTIGLILDAKKKGLETFDFWGIAPDGAPANHPWAGFTAFKKTFAGSERRYAGTYDLVLNPAKYRLYQLFRRLNRLRRKI